MKIILAGGSGFIGGALLNRLLKLGHQVTLLTRNPSKVKLHPFLTLQKWDGRNSDDWFACLENSDAVINLSGESIVARRWTRNQKEKIIRSRVESTQVIIQAIQQVKVKPKVLVNASAVGYYGNVPTGIVTEQSFRGSGFLSDTCVEWESTAQKVQDCGVRLVSIRIGVVLGKDGGALSKMLLPFKLFIGGPVGSGRQGFPWVHRDDVMGVILLALQNSQVSGPINVVGPELVNLKEFCTVLGQVIHRPSWMRIPAFVLKFLLGEMSSLLLDGQHIVPEKLQKLGYQFKYATVSDALKEILN